jgi:glutamyl-tRNA synthetase
MLGWNPGTEQEVFTMDELIDAFTIERIGKAGAKFDFEKGKWFNQQFLHKKNGMELAELVKPLLKQNGVEKDNAFIEQFCKLMLDRVTFIEDFWKLGNYFFKRPETYDEKTLAKRWKPESKGVFEKLMGRVE